MPTLQQQLQPRARLPQSEDKMSDYKHEVQDYNNGQIYGWNGGECPVHPETVVKFWMREDRIHLDNKALAKELTWKHEDEDWDIIAFQVVNAYVEPKVIWVNEYVNGPVAFNTERSARSYAMPSAVRIAVKYVEVVDDKEVKE